MAHIAIFCDGTWSSAQTETGTHVLRLCSACARDDTQHVLYIEGVGTGAGKTSDLGRKINQIGGVLFGWGLNRNIKSAYQALCETYHPGDKIMIFGFSRGAYTARSLAGMIRKCGILENPTQANVARAFRLYRTRGAQNSPDAAHIRAQRRELSPHFATSQADVLERQDESALVRITYLGIWDTVGALGLPETIMGRIANWWNARYKFHDTSLTHLVESARHAVALDERRVLFEPSLWNNLDANGEHIGLNRGDTSPTRPYQQTWFVGDHGMVGGSAKTRALSEITLTWIWEGAAQLGLRLKPGERIPQVRTNPSSPTREIDDTGMLYRLIPALMAWRAGPKRAQDLHDSARMRLVRVSSYRPGSLLRLMPALLRNN